MTGEGFLAIDWGTSNRRIYLFDGVGTLRATERDDRGLSVVSREAFPLEVAEIRARLGDLPMLCAGMVGSASGWVDASYCPCPAALEDLAEAISWVEPGRTAIVPGVSFEKDSRSDLMRGEEVQLLGAAAEGLVSRDALLCQPGTHCKWACITNGRIDSFRTTMTGELFGYLKHHGVLAEYMTGEVASGEAFHRGLAQSSSRSLLGDLFCARVAVLQGKRDISDTAAYVSGLLIGNDVLEQEIGAGNLVHVLAVPLLGDLYGAAIGAAGGEAVLLDSEDAFVAGITRLWALVQ